MAWKPKFFSPREKASAEDVDDDVIDAESLTDDVEATGNAPTAATDAPQIAALTEQVTALTAQVATLTADLKASQDANATLTADLRAAQDATASQQVSALELAQDSAHAAAVRAFGQGTAKLEQAEADIAACETEREARALERAFVAATPDALNAQRRQTQAHLAGKNGGKTGATNEDRERVASHTRGAF